MKSKNITEGRALYAKHRANALSVIAECDAHIERLKKEGASRATIWLFKQQKRSTEKVLNDLDDAYAKLEEILK